jgi:hypothetical protein
VPAQPPRDSTIAVVGDGPDSLIVYATGGCRWTSGSRSRTLRGTSSQWRGWRERVEAGRAEGRFDELLGSARR